MVNALDCQLCLDNSLTFLLISQFLLLKAAKHTLQYKNFFNVYLELFIHRKDAII